MSSGCRDAADRKLPDDDFVLPTGDFKKTAQMVKSPAAGALILPASTGSLSEVDPATATWMTPCIWRVP